MIIQTLTVLVCYYGFCPLSFFVSSFGPPLRRYPTNFIVLCFAFIRPMVGAFCFSCFIFWHASFEVPSKFLFVYCLFGQFVSCFVCFGQQKGIQESRPEWGRTPVVSRITAETLYRREEPLLTIFCCHKAPFLAFHSKFICLLCLCYHFSV